MYGATPNRSPTRFTGDLYKALERSPPRRRPTANDRATMPGRMPAPGSPGKFPSVDLDVTSILGKFPTHDETSRRGTMLGRTPITRNTFDIAGNYFFGVWRRTPFDFYGAPQCLNGTGGAAHLTEYDVAQGNLWSVIPSEVHANGFYLQCGDVGDARFLADNLELVQYQERAALWRFEFTAPFRGGTHDIAIKISNDRGQLLCSDESTGRVLVLAPREADVQSHDGTWQYNDAWECTPDMDDLEVDRFLSTVMGDENPLSV